MDRESHRGFPLFPNFPTSLLIVDPKEIFCVVIYLKTPNFSSQSISINLLPQEVIPLGSSSTIRYFRRLIKCRTKITRVTSHVTEFVSDLQTTLLTLIIQI